MVLAYILPFKSNVDVNNTFVGTVNYCNFGQSKGDNAVQYDPIKPMIELIRDLVVIYILTQLIFILSC